MKFYSLEQICDHFSLTPGPIDALLNELRHRRTAIHPDRNGGSFKTDTDEQAYHDFNDAITWMEGQGQLIPVNQIVDLVKVLSGLQLREDTRVNKHDVNQTIEVRKKALSETLNQIREFQSRKFKLPIVAASSIAAIVTFLFFFPEKIAGHPILNKFINVESFAFAQVWLVSVGVFAWAWVYSYVADNRRTQINSLIQSESYQNELFQQFYVDGMKESDASRTFSFTKSNLVKHIVKASNRTQRSTVVQFILTVYTAGLYKQNIIINDEVAENLASLIIEKLVARNAVRANGLLNFETRFEALESELKK